MGDKRVFDNPGDEKQESTTGQTEGRLRADAYGNSRPTDNSVRTTDGGPRQGAGSSSIAEIDNPYTYLHSEGRSILRPT